MAIKGGDLIHVGNQVLIDRAQTAGPGQVNITTEKIYELGNYKSIGSIRQTPDVSFDLESFDASAEFESLLVGIRDYDDVDAGTAIDPAKSVPMDVVSSFKAGFTATNAYDVVGSVAIPYLTLESLSYRFGIADNATQSATLRGDGVYYAPSSTFVEETAGTNAAGQTVALANPAVVYKGDTTAGDRYAISVSLRSGKRLSHGADYTETVTGTGVARTVSVVIARPVATTDAVRVVYASNVVATYPQASHEPVSAVRPAALRGRDIEVFVGGVELSDRWTSVQSANIDWRVTLDRDEELGNAQIVGQDFDAPEVSGSLELKPRDYRELYEKVATVSNVTVGEVAGPLSSQPLELLIVLHSPDTGEILKSLYVPDARFTMPGYSGRVQTKTTVTLNFESDEGTLVIYKGERPEDPAAPVAPPAPAPTPGP